jgi:hypothetical protein
MLRHLFIQKRLVQEIMCCLPSYLTRIEHLFCAFSWGLQMSTDEMIMSGLWLLYNYTHGVKRCVRGVSEMKRYTEDVLPPGTPVVLSKSVKDDIDVVLFIGLKEHKTTHHAPGPSKRDLLVSQALHTTLATSLEALTIAQCPASIYSMFLCSPSRFDMAS